MGLHRFRTDRTGGSERGSALVEFALILPVLMSLLLGTVTGGMAYNRKLAMTGAVREGSRFAATLDAPTTAGWAADVSARTIGLSTGDLSSTDSSVCVKLVKVTALPATVGTVSNYYTTPAGCGTNASDEPAVPTGGLSVGDCLVKVWAQRPARIQAILFSSTITLKARAVARYEATAMDSSGTKLCE